MPTRGGDGAGATTAAQRRRNKRAIQRQKLRQEAQAAARVQTPRLEQPRYVYPPQPLPKDFTGLSEKQEKTLRALGARKSGGALARGIEKTAKFGTESVKASHQLLQANARAYTDPTPKNIKQAGLLNAAVAKEIALAPYHDVRDRNYPLIFLDALAALSLGAGGTARGVMATRALKEGASLRQAAKVAKLRPVPEQVLPKRLLPKEKPEIRSVTYEGVPVQVPLQSRSIPTAAAQHAYDRLGEKIPNLPGVGARARVARRIPEIQATRELRAHAKAIPFEVASRKLRGRLRRTTTPKEMAYSVIADYGYTGKEGERLLQMEIDRRKARLSNLEGRAAEIQQRRIDLLEAAKPLVREPPEELLAATTLGKQVADVTTQMRLERQQRPLSEMAAEAAPAHHIRMVHGAEYVEPTAAKRGVPSKALERQRAEVDRLQGLFDRAVAREAKAPRGSSVHQFKMKGAYYHVAPKSQRENIAREGLQDKLTGKGVHLWDNPEDAAVYQKLVGGDIYEVDASGLDLGADPWWDVAGRRERWAGPGRSFVVNEPISESRLVRAGESTAARGPIAQRLGAALSVQKDKLARMEAAAAKKVEPTGLVGAEDIAPGPLGFFRTDRAERQLGGLFRRRQSLETRGQKFHHRTGESFWAALDQVGPRPTLDDYLREVRLRGQQADTELAYSFSKPFDEMAYDPAKQEILNPASKEIPRTSIADIPELELEGMSPAEIAGSLLKEREEWIRNTFHRDPSTVLPEHRLGLRVVDKKIADAIKGLDTWQAPAENSLLKLLDVSNALNRSVLVYLNPAYGPVQRVGNYAFRSLQGTAFAPENLKLTTKVLSDLDEAQLARVDLEVGGGAAASLLHKTTGGPLVKPQETLADIQNLLADRGPRRQAWAYEAAQEGYDTPAKIARLLEDPALEPKLNVISERAQQAMVKFRRTPTSTRRMLNRAIFILPWIEGSTRYVGRLILDHPVNARIAAGVRDQIEERQRKILGEAKLGLPGFVPINDRVGVNLTAVSPFSTFSEIASMAQDVAGMRRPTPAGLEPLSLLQPTLTAGIESLGRFNLYGGYRYPETKSRASIALDNLLGTVERPVSGLGATVKTALGGTGSTQGVYQPESGIQDALLRGFLGSARPRRPNMEMAEKRGKERLRASMNPEQRARSDGRDYLRKTAANARRLGLDDLPNEVRQAIRLRTQQRTAWAKDKARTQPERLLAEVKLLASQGKIDRAEIKAAEEWLATEPTSRQIEYKRSIISRLYFGSEILSQFNSALNQGLEARGLNP